MEDDRETLRSLEQNIERLGQVIRRNADKIKSQQQQIDAMHATIARLQHELTEQQQLNSTLSLSKMIVADGASASAVRARITDMIKQIDKGLALLQNK